MSFELIEAEKANFPKALMCRALGLSRSGNHAFETRGPSKRDLEQQKLDVAAAAIFAEEEGRYGAPRVEKALRRRGTRTSRKRVARSLARQGLIARQRRRWRSTTDSSHREPIAPNLLARDFTADAPDKVWVADTTYLPVIGGFIFLAVIIDLFSRKVVGWQLGDYLDAELSGEALRKALARRCPAPGLLFHSDRGIEFAAKSFRALLTQAGAVQSMSRKGNCWDNAPSESFFSTLEFEMVPGSAWRKATDAEHEMFTFIESYYNSRRLHSQNDYNSPNETEFNWRSRALAA
jgi:transposase InsO family protein